MQMQQMQYMNAPPDIQAGASQLFQQQKLAELLRQQASTPIQADEYTKSGSGQWAAPPQIVKVGLGQGLAKLAEGGLGAYVQNNANDQQVALAQKLRDARDKEFSDYQNAGQATPAQPMGPPTDDGKYGVQPGKEADPMAQALRGVQSFDPMLQKIGVHQFTNILDQNNTMALMDRINNAEKLAQSAAQPDAQPAQSVATVYPPISTSDANPTPLSPTASIAAPNGPPTQEQRQLIAAELAKTGDMQGANAIMATSAKQTSAQLTPLEMYAKQVGHTLAGAQAMATSGDKNLMPLGKQLVAGYQQAMMETSLKQPDRQQLATQSQNAASDRQDKAIAAADNRQQNSFAQKMENAQLSPDAIENAAENYRITGQLPAMGMGGLAEKAKILNRAAEQAKENGTTPEALSLGMMAGKANTAALTQVTKQEQMIGSFEKNANANADLALSLGKSVDRTGVPIITRWVQAGQKAIAGDTDVSKFHAATETFINEYAKIMSGSMGNTAVSDAARTHAHSMLSTAMTQDQYEGVINTLKKEMGNRMNGFAAQKQELLNSMKKFPQAPVAPPPPAPTGVNGIPTGQPPTVVREVLLKDGRIGVEYSDGTRGFK
jgi:hypothetical protein